MTDPKKPDSLDEKFKNVRPEHVAEARKRAAADPAKLPINQRGLQAHAISWLKEYDEYMARKSGKRKINPFNPPKDATPKEVNAMLRGGLQFFARKKAEAQQAVKESAARDQDAAKEKAARVAALRNRHTTEAKVTFGQAARFMWHPEPGKSLQSLAASKTLLIQFFTGILIAVGLLPKDHPARLYQGAREFHIFPVLEEARLNLPPVRFIWEGLATDLPVNARILAVKQYAVLSSVMCVIVAGGLSMVMFASRYIFGATRAFAQVIDQGPGIGSGVTATGDLGSNMIDAFLGTGNQQSIVMNGLGSLFKFYNNIALVFAGIIVLWIILSAVAETARTGIPMGKQFNHVWAPVRLIVALGLLVPLGSGLNSGQEIISYLTKWGSQQTSSMWSIFTDKMMVGTDSNGQVTGGLPSVPVSLNTYRGVADNIFDASVCQAINNHYNGANYVSQDMGNTISTPPTQAVVPVTGAAQVNAPPISLVTKFTWVHHMAGSTSKVDVNCGSLNINTPNLSALSGKQLTADDQATVDIINSQTQSVLDFVKNTQGLAQQIADAAIAYTESGGAIDNFPDDTTYFNQYQTAVDSYANSRITGLQTALQKYNGNFAADMKKDAQTGGWISAPIWLSRIAQQNGRVIEAAQITPSVSPADTSTIDGTSSSAFNLAQDYLGNARPANLSPYTSSLDVDSNAMANALKQITAPSANPLGTQASYGRQMINVGVEMMTPPSLIACLENPFANGCDFVLQEAMASNTSLATAVNARGGVQSVLAAAKANPALSKSLDEQYQKQVLNNQTILPSGAKLKMIEEMGNIARGKSSARALVYPAGIVLIGFGVMEGYMLPLIPTLRFILGVLGWALMIFEAELAISLVALTLLKTDGEGFGTQHFQSSLTMILGIVLRPAFMIFGLIMGLMAFNGIMQITSYIFLPMVVNLSNSSGNADTSILSTAVYMIIYGTFVYTLANSSFKAIDMLPNYVMGWIGQRMESRVDDASVVQQQAQGYIQNMAFQMRPEPRQFKEGYSKWVSTRFGSDASGGGTSQTTSTNQGDSGSKAPSSQSATTSGNKKPRKWQ